MKIDTVLTVCTGNICRSPMAAAALAEALPEVEVSSAGLHALVGHPMDKDSEAAAAERGMPTPPHKARQFDEEIGRASDLILVLDKGHRDEIVDRFPHFLGKTFLLGHFAGGRDVPDPYKMPMGQHLHAADLIKEFTQEWASKIKAMKS